MPTVICVANMKGGVGKTAVSVNLAYEFFDRGNKVLVVDNDPQFNASSALIAPEKYIKEYIEGDAKTIYDIYEKPPSIRGKTRPPVDGKSVIKRLHTRARSNAILDIIPSRIELHDTLRNPSAKEYLLDKFLEKHAQKYDYVFIDCPPTPSVLTISAFAASDYVLIPVTPDYFATLGLPQFLGTLADFKNDQHDNHHIAALGVVFTKVPRQANPLTDKAKQRVADALVDSDVDVPVFETELSALRIFERSVWESSPVRLASGVRGQATAVSELEDLAEEIEEWMEVFETESDEDED